MCRKLKQFEVFVPSLSDLHLGCTKAKFEMSRNQSCGDNSLCDSIRGLGSFHPQLTGGFLDDLFCWPLFLNMETANTFPFHQSCGKARSEREKFYLRVVLGSTKKPQTNVVSKSLLCLAETKTKVFSFSFFLFKRISQKIMLSKDKLLNPYFNPLINILPSLKGSLPRYFPSCQTSHAQYFKFSRRQNTSVTKRKFRKGCMCKRVSPDYSQSHATGCPALLLNWWEALVRRCSRESKAVGITS